MAVNELIGIFNNAKKKKVVPVSGGNMTPQTYENWDTNVRDKGGGVNELIDDLKRYNPPREQSRKPMGMKEDMVKAKSMGIDEGLVRPDQFSKWTQGEKRRWLKSKNLKKYSNRPRLKSGM